MYAGYRRSVVIGLSAEGTLLAVRDDGFWNACRLCARPVLNTIGAGDALFSAFIHVYAESGDPYAAMTKAMTFASYKIGATGAADGFLSATELEHLHAGVSIEIIRDHTRTP